ncbi:MAG: gamma-glutamylcyclotransferase [Candidatus Rokubacteria bacterium]|nr:gamma-glutamylcyclotransferase [Candidatus Rokubacteria bacterium]
MRGFPLHHLLAGRAQYLGSGSVPARLLDLGSYPGAVADPAGAVRGELYRVPSAALWRALDWAEGPQYDRGGVTVTLDDGQEVPALMYWYRGSPDRGIPIPGGDYRAAGPARSFHRSKRPEEATDGA